MDDLQSAIDQAFDEWTATWDLADMSLRDVYEAGFRHGHELAQNKEKQA
jgi:hypothetical protein